MSAPSYIAPLPLQLNSLNFPFIATTLILIIIAMIVIIIIISNKNINGNQCFLVAEQPE